MTDLDTAQDAAIDDDFSDVAATFGDRIVAAREALGLTSAELAKRLGVKPQTLSNWEEDRSEPRANKLQMLAGLLNVSIIWLMSGEGQGVELRQNGSAVEDVEALARELREVRRLQSDVVARLLRLERRLIALRR